MIEAGDVRVYTRSERWYSKQVVRSATGLCDRFPGIDLAPDTRRFAPDIERNESHPKSQNIARLHLFGAPGEPTPPERAFRLCSICVIRRKTGFAAALCS